MAFHHTIVDLALFVAPAIAVALTDQEKSDLAHFEQMLSRRRNELAMCNRNRAFANRVAAIKADIVQIETAIADLKTTARYRRV